MPQCENSSTSKNKAYLGSNCGRGRLRFWGSVKSSGEPRNKKCCAAFRKTDGGLKVNQLRPPQSRNPQLLAFASTFQPPLRLAPGLPPSDPYLIPNIGSCAFAIYHPLILTRLFQQSLFLFVLELGEAGGNFPTVRGASICTKRAPPIQFLTKVACKSNRL
jgi:hypothetical protein